MGAVPTPRPRAPLHEHERARRRGRADSVELARSYADLLAPLLVVGHDDLVDALALYERADAFDAVLAAAARRACAAALVCADHVFATVPGLPHLDPGAPDFAEALAELR